MTKTQKIFERINKTINTPDMHRKLLIHDAFPILSSASVEVSDYIESQDDDKLNREWLKLTGEAQTVLLDMAEFIQKKIK